MIYISKTQRFYQEMAVHRQVNVKAKILRQKNFSNNFCIFTCRQGGMDFSALGNVPGLEGSSYEGAIADFLGEWCIHPVYGKQLKFASLKVEGGELYFFLTRVVKGIGEALAKSLIEHFGEEELERILTEEPSLLEKVKGIKKAKAEKIRASWIKFGPLRRLSNLLSPYGVSVNLCTRIFNHFGDTAASVVKANPYALTAVHGVGFKRADEVAMKLGVSPHDDARIDACIQYVFLREANDGGNTVIQATDIIALVKEEVDLESAKVDPSGVQARMDALIGGGDLIQVGHAGYAHSSFYGVERQILKSVKARAALQLQPIMEGERLERFIGEQENLIGFAFCEEQKAAIRLAASGHMTFLLAGSAGSGKTSVMKAILNLLATRYGKAIKCMALAGIASDRIRKVTGYDSATIHTSLGFKEGGGFLHDRNNPFEERVIVVEESSMVNCLLMRRVLDAVSPDTVLILLGDPGQLEAIGPGDVFKNLLDSGLIPTIKLVQIWRTSKDSVLNVFANQVRSGRVPENYLESGYRDFEFVGKTVEDYFPTPQDYYRKRQQMPKTQLDGLVARSMNDVLAVVAGKVKALKRIVDDPVADFQVLTAVKKGPLGTRSLNNLVQSIFNPLEDGQGEFVQQGVSYRAGDKVVHTKNKNMLVVPMDHYMSRGFVAGAATEGRIFNGMVGIIVDICEATKCVFVEYDYRIVVKYEAVDLGDILELGYAVTVHKSQGNEYRFTIIPIVPQHFIMLTAKWLYTALTRAKNKAVCVGSPAMFAKACQSQDNKQRNTVLNFLLAD